MAITANATLVRSDKRKMDQFVIYVDDSILLKPKELSFAEVAKEFIGCLDSNLEDLSYNPRYMEGFGK